MKRLQCWALLLACAVANFPWVEPTLARTPENLQIEAVGPVLAAKKGEDEAPSQPAVVIYGGLDRLGDEPLAIDAVYAAGGPSATSAVAVMDHAPVVVGDLRALWADGATGCSDGPASVVDMMSLVDEGWELIVFEEAEMAVTSIELAETMVPCLTDLIDVSDLASIYAGLAAARIAQDPNNTGPAKEALATALRVDPELVWDGGWPQEGNAVFEEVDAERYDVPDSFVRSLEDYGVVMLGGRSLGDTLMTVSPGRHLVQYETAEGIVSSLVEIPAGVEVWFGTGDKIWTSFSDVDADPQPDWITSARRKLALTLEGDPWLMTANGAFPLDLASGTVREAPGSSGGGGGKTPGGRRGGKAPKADGGGTSQARGGYFEFGVGYLLMDKTLVFERSTSPSFHWVQPQLGFGILIGDVADLHFLANLAVGGRGRDALGQYVELLPSVRLGLGLQHNDGSHRPGLRLDALIQIPGNEFTDKDGDGVDDAKFDLMGGPVAALTIAGVGAGPAWGVIEVAGGYVWASSIKSGGPVIMAQVKVQMRGGNE